MKISPTEALARLKEVRSSEHRESAIAEADRMLCGVLEYLGHENIVAEWAKVRAGQ
jgi:hypothetical protein